MANAAEAEMESKHQLLRKLAKEVAGKKVQVIHWMRCMLVIHSLVVLLAQTRVFDRMWLLEWKVAV